MRVHLLTIVGLLNSVVIDCFLDEGPQLGILVDLSLAFRLLHIKLNLHLLHLLVEVGSEAETFLTLLLRRPAARPQELPPGTTKVPENPASPKIILRNSEIHVEIIYQ
jgi:hypothetical protein